MTADRYVTRRHVLRPDVTADHVDEVARSLDWPLVHQQDRDREAGVDGQLIWQGPEVSLHYIVDATSGIGYVLLAGKDEEAVEPAARQVVARLAPWTLEELFAAFDKADTARDRAQFALRIGLAAPKDFDEGVFRRIGAALSDQEPKVRYAGLWASTYTGWTEFVPVMENIALNDPEEYVRSRAASILEAFRRAGEQS
ncbi:hypothetical protein [Wenjunlia tyrosinilytica]|uniref:HEAT repeat domain-containing protein n=1 Tax=Wenjunlia tyrosinilytica TaxID=1544741 RepID=A0A918DZS4_9ACTN|nr:hypothetical protein [Wenjunlia tyrosinilytica]GGO94890.1 hypothetical protein GCM10012280_50840 [Wenjunlia tyrosinilytica]